MCAFVIIISHLSKWKFHFWVKSNHLIIPKRCMNPFLDILSKTSPLKPLGLTYLLESRTLAILHRIYGIERHAEWMNWFITSLQMGVVRLPFVSQMTSSGMLPLTQLEICSHLQTYMYLTYTYIGFWNWINSAKKIWLIYTKKMFF